MKKITSILTIVFFISVLSFLYYSYGLPFKIFFGRVLEMSFPVFVFNFIPYIYLRFSNFGVGVPFIFMCIFVIMGVFVVLFLVNFFYKRKKHIGFQEIIQVCLTLIVMLTALRSVAYINFMAKVKKFFLTKTAEEKLCASYGVVHKFADEVKKVLPERSTVVLINGYENIENMQVAMQLAYFLYPIDLRHIRQDDVDAYLIFNKENAESYVPDDFIIVKELDERSLIAVKRIDHG